MSAAGTGPQRTDLTKRPPHAPAGGGAGGGSGGGRRGGRLSGRGLELTLLALAGAIVALTIGLTLRVGLAGDGRTDDLTFAGTLQELSTVLQAGGRDRVARLEPAELRVGGQGTALDTVAVIADLEDRPGARPGGFIHDHARLYNDHVIRQAVLSAVYGSDPATADGPSILRTVRGTDGSRRLSDRPNPFVLAVRSPHAERSWREVRTADWQRASGLVGLQGDMPLSGELATGGSTLLNGRDCQTRQDDAGLLLYCGSQLASDVGRFYDLGFELPSGEPAFSTTRAFLYRPQDVWFNGAARNGTQHDLRAGDVLDVPRVGPFVMSVAERGTLAAGQWINGRQTFANQRPGTLGFFAAAGRSAAPDGQAQPIVLGLDAALSLELEAAAARLMLEHGQALRRVAVVVVDVRTGVLRAIAEPGRTSDAEPLLAFEPVLIGSVAKPLIAAAILARRPELGSTTVNWDGDVVASVAGVALRSPFANAANGCFGTIDLVNFLRCSSNQYAAELMMRSLIADGYQPSADSIVSREVLERSAIGSGLAEAFDVDAAAWRNAARAPWSWSALVDPGSGTTTRTDPVLLPWESRPWLLFPDTPGTRPDLLARFAFGGWENRWTLLGAAEAYARIATGREVQLRMLAQQPGAAPPAALPSLPANVEAAFRRLRPGLRDAGVTGTAAGLADRLQAALPGDPVVLTKTGTLNEATDRFRALALVLGQPAGPERDAPLTCGLVAITYFEFANVPQRAGERTPLPAVHLEFARDGFAATLARHWDRVAGCPAGAGGGA